MNKRLADDFTCAGGGGCGLNDDVLAFHHAVDVFGDSKIRFDPFKVGMLAPGLSREMCGCDFIALIFGISLSKIAPNESGGTTYE
jgi:hypothetical protein